MAEGFNDFEELTEEMLGSGPKSLAGAQTLVLNADYSPLSYSPLSLWPWQRAIKLVVEDVVDPLAYHDIVIRSAHRTHRVPSVIALRHFVKPPKRIPFTRYNVYLRDLFVCQYCGQRFPASGLTWDHVFPQSRGGRTNWENIVSACHACNTRKADLTCREAGMFPKVTPYEPAVFEIREKGQRFPPHNLHQTWRDYCYWNSELEP